MKPSGHVLNHAATFDITYVVRVGSSSNRFIKVSFLLVAVSFGTFASIARSTQVSILSGLDEAQHWDNVIKYSRFEIPRYEGNLDPEVVASISCYDIDPWDDRPDEISRGSTACVTPQYAGVVAAGPYEAGQPPLYYVALSAIERLFGRNTIPAMPTHLRLVNSLVLALVIVTTYFTLRSDPEKRSHDGHHVPEVAAHTTQATTRFASVVVPTLFTLSPAMIEASGIVSNDMIAVLASSICAYLYKRARRSEQSTLVSILSGIGIGAAMASTKATTIAPICVLIFLTAIPSFRAEHRVANRQPNIFATAVTVSWVAVSALWALLVDRLTTTPIRSLPVFQLWREPLPDALLRAAKGIPIMEIHGLFGANSDSIAYKLTEKLGWVILLCLILSSGVLLARRSNIGMDVLAVTIAIWAAGPIMCIATYIGTSKPHADSRLLLPVVPWALLTLSVSARSLMRGRLSSPLVNATASILLIGLIVTTGSYLIPILA